MQSELSLVSTFDVPLTIGVISDTHIYEHGAKTLPTEVLTCFRRAGVDLLLHLGDINVVSVLDELSAVAPILAVQGNNDSLDLLAQLPMMRKLHVGPFTIGMVHGHGGRSARYQVEEVLAGEVDLACFGHSHIPVIDEADGTILLNPGSATDRRWHKHFGIAIVTISEEAIHPELILYSNPKHLDNVNFDRPDPTSTPFPTHGSSTS